MKNLPRTLLHAGFGLTALALAASGCGDDTPPGAAGDGGVTADVPTRAPAFRNPVMMPDDELARAALAIMQMPEQGEMSACSTCHGITRQTVRHWRALTDAALGSCLTDLDVRTPEAAQRMIACLRDPTTMQFTPQRLGIATVATHLDWFRYVTQRGAGTAAEATRTDLVNRTAMPPGMATRLTQRQFDILAEWFIRGVPALDENLPEDPRPESCTPGVSREVTTHVQAMATMGWAARNRARNMLMHGCNGAARPIDCLQSVPRASTQSFAARWEHLPGAKLRLLHTTSYASSYWTRSSVDGRFVSHGARTAAPQGRFIDLQTNRVISTAGQYDPGFFPDNSGFVFMGVGNSGAVCTMNVLTMGNPTALTLTEPGCSRSGTVGLYEHVATSLDGADYWFGFGQFESDDGGRAARTTQPRAPFTANSVTRLVQMANTGSGFTQNFMASVPTPFEADATITPSGRFLALRVAGNNNAQLGMVLRRINVTGTGADREVTLPEVARYCFNGAKPAFSLDERWIVTHRYIQRDDAQALGFTGPDDPAFAEYASRGGANIWLIDMLTGASHRVTHMSPGQYALFPHFRSDGWIYFQVRTLGQTRDHIVASDAALVLAAR